MKASERYVFFDLDGFDLDGFLREERRKRRFVCKCSLAFSWGIALAAAIYRPEQCWAFFTIVGSCSIGPVVLWRDNRESKWS